MAALTWLEPWECVDTDQAQVMDKELLREVQPGHALHGRACRAVAIRGDQDDVLFIVDGDKLAVVHLTWKCPGPTQVLWVRPT